MYDRILRQIREKILTRHYVMTLHAEEEMANDGLTILDVESGILTGNIKRRQKDRDSGEWKYLIEGKTLTGDGIVVVGKLGATGKFVMITVFLE